ncbi:MAG TPA: hypothetical protein DCY93_01290 [Firmicutes bacterium]|nr:hypothetical protein [Bacillota bacterium]
MNVSIIFIAALLCIVFYGLFASYNRLIRTNIGFLVSFASIIIFYAVEILSGNRYFTSLITDLYVVSPFASLESFIILFYLAVFILAYIVTRLILHFCCVGKSPSYHPKHRKYIHIINSLGFLAFAFGLTSLIVPYFHDYFNMPNGFMESYFALIYGWML